MQPPAPTNIPATDAPTDLSKARLAIVVGNQVMHIPAQGFSDALGFITLAEVQALGYATLTGTETLTNKTLTSPTINNGSIVQPTLTLKQSTNPTPTGEGDAQWDTDDNVLVIGDGAAQKIFIALPASTAAGDMLYLSGAKAFARVAKGTAGQIWTMNAGATAPEWQTLSVPTPDYGLGNAALSYGAVGTYILGSLGGTAISANSTYSGSSISVAGAQNFSGTGNPAALATGSTLSGTWRAMAQASAGAGTPNRNLGLFLRIS